MPVVTHDAPQLAQLRHQVLALLLNNRPLVDSILSLPGRDAAEPDAVLLDQTARLAGIQRQLHAADLADLLESLPPEARLALWRLIDNDKRGKTLVEASENVWDSLLAEMAPGEILRAMRPLDVDEQAYLARYLPRDIVGRMLTAMEPPRRAQVRAMMNFAPDCVGRYMDFELATLRPDVSLATAQRYLRWRKTLPPNSDKLFVVDRRGKLVGELPLSALLLNPLDKQVAEVMETDPQRFLPEDSARAAAGAFERYDLISAAVVDVKGKLMGRLCIEHVVDVFFTESDSTLRRLGGISPAEDIFAPVRKAVRARWTWLAVNLCTAFAASRVIGLFEGTISALVSLAALMPIVAGIGGNTGNQTITMIVRAQALRQLETGNTLFLLLREMGVAIINGLIWGGIMGLVTWLLYHNAGLGAVMMLAMLLNLMLAALMGVAIPLTMARAGRDPAVGSSVIITAITDTGGFFIFLGLATLFLLR
ncbi:magnesium transporter [Martelella alba]|uniref:Magnesium transporter n=1 Tax=Martelella alba TaxID=2590451 RepID=A0ABY2SLN6_9HYPH|nr:magnesium transporter [Martelella alba]TKI06681.1 magnesium transporter [Martelella alba]